MQVILDEQTMKEVTEQAKAQILNQLVSQFNIPQIAAEIRNAAVKEVAAQISAKIKADARIEEAIHRAIQSCESRIGNLVSKTLKSGIKICLITDE